MKIERKANYDYTSRGYRNNNPLNLRITGNRWKGKVPQAQNTDGSFEQFQTMAYGFRAALIVLRRYIRKYSRCTIESIVQRWAPTEDGNDPVRYADVVAARTGIHRTATIEANDKERLCQIAAAMAYVENGSAPQMDDIYAGWHLLSDSTR